MASINFSANQAISGIALNIAAPAVSIFAARLIIGRQQISFSNVFRIEAVPGLSKIPVIGDIFFQDVYISFYIAVAVAILGGVLINKTRFGLRLKACGEFPQAADSVGVNVYKMRYMAASSAAPWRAWPASCWWCPPPQSSTPRWPATASWRCPC